jgi:hypothetical protein
MKSGFIGLSAWELACHALPTTVFAVQRLFALSVSVRYRPSQTVLPGTQRARPVWSIATLLSGLGQYGVDVGGGRDRSSVGYSIARKSVSRAPASARCCLPLL